VGATDPPLAARWGKAYSRSPASRTLPTGSARCGGSRAEIASRPLAVAEAIATPNGWRFCVGGVAQRPRKPKARATRSSPQGPRRKPVPNRVQRVRLSGLPAR